jgi:hypothetical protein|eukprot:CAMPEP_0174288554 /NCGR_PEP_ID=MMETSP0809-20121228/21260_1 /TAXON_ID=73025 ORGANISM="Eutreptiella gymnastica-like, Strain CCMP1594" /NCGR_SAMPLE_ID=MMETSP0809 /ASSEMBLY_ACC=CAM_ASM_000658 /LENGTH=112 /DNA_ID=CAMNT_0015385851 /DNA_START=21 /DNA_END=359 /DNA_ORIENTATION=-
MPEANRKDASATAWASPNEHLMFNEYTSWTVLNVQKRWMSWVATKKSFLNATSSPWWSPQFFLLTFFQLRNSSNKLSENYTWAPKGDDFNVMLPSPPEPFGRDLKIHQESTH